MRRGSAAMTPAGRPVSRIRLFHLTDKSKSSELFAFARFRNQVSQVNQVKRPLLGRKEQSNGKEDLRLPVPTVDGVLPRRPHRDGRGRMLDVRPGPRSQRLLTLRPEACDPSAEIARPFGEDRATLCRRAPDPLGSAEGPFAVLGCEYGKGFAKVRQRVGESTAKSPGEHGKGFQSPRGGCPAANTQRKHKGKEANNG